MAAYRKRFTVEDPNRVILSGLPFRAGQRVEIVITADDDPQARVEELRTLLRETQALPQARAISDDEIAVEIAAHRGGR